MVLKDGIGPFWTPRWCLRQESNLYLSLRRTPFYPLNYEDRMGMREAASPVRARDFIGFAMTVPAGGVPGPSRIACAGLPRYEICKKLTAIKPPRIGGAHHRARSHLCSDSRTKKSEITTQETT